MARENNIGRWHGEATMNAGGFLGANKAMEDQSRRTASTVQQNYKGLESGLESIFGRMGAAVKFAGISFGFENIGPALGLQAIRSGFNMLAEFAGDAESFGFLNDHLGTSIQFLSSLRTVAGEAGISTDKFSNAMNRLNQTIGRANQGDQGALALLRDLGVSASDFAGGNTDEGIRRVLTGLAAIENRSVRARLSTELFGREGGAAMLRLAMNADQLGAALADIRARGGFIDEAELARLQRLDQQIDRLGTRWQSMRRSAAGAIAESVEGLSILLGLEDGPVQRAEARLRQLEEEERRRREFMARLQGIDPSQIPFLGSGAQPLVPGSGPGGNFSAASPEATMSSAMSAMLEAQAALAVEAAALGQQMADDAERQRERRFERERVAQMRAEADRITAQEMGPFDAFAAQMMRLNEMFNEGELGADAFNAAAARAVNVMAAATGAAAPAGPSSTLTQGSAAAQAVINAQRQQGVQEQIRDSINLALRVQEQTREYNRRVAEALEGVGVVD